MVTAVFIFLPIQDKVDGEFLQLLRMPSGGPFSLLLDYYHPAEPLRRAIFDSTSIIRV